MKFRCKKNCFDGDAQELIWAFGQLYSLCFQDAMGFVINGDDGNAYMIGKPGDQFFDKCFEIVDEA